MRTITAAVAATALLTGACSSNYVPRSRGRIAVMLQGGQQVYVRDGVVYRNGILGGGLGDAVAGNPEAERAADEYSSRLKTGLLVGLGGLTCSLVATGLAMRHIDEDPYGEGNDAPPTELWVALGCLVVSMGGLGYLVTAEPYRWDAINIFNDGADTAPALPAGPPGRWSARPPLPNKLSLKIDD